MPKVYDIDVRGLYKTFFIAGDWHSLSVDRSAVQILLNHALMYPYNERNLIINGDFFDAPYFMMKKDFNQQWAKRTTGVDDYFLPKYLEEMKWANDTLDLLQTVFKTTYYVDGNHCEVRVKNFRENFCPVGFQPLFNSYVSMRLDERKIQYIEYNDYFRIIGVDPDSSLYVTHGTHHGVSALKKHYEDSRANNVVFSHVHQENVASYRALGKSTQARSLPAMCDLSPEYMRNAPNNWSLGYGTIHFRPSGHFNFYTHLIWDNELVLHSNQVIRANKTLCLP